MADILGSVVQAARKMTDRFRAVVDERWSIKSVALLETGFVECRKCNTTYSLDATAPLSMAKCAKCQDLVFFPMKLLNAWLVEPLGAGGFGSVYLGRLSEDPQQKVTVKLLRHAGADRRDIAILRAEAEVASAIPKHPNIPEVYAHGSTDDATYLVMEYVPGTRLQHMVEFGGRVDAEEVLYYALDIVDALDHILAAGYVHRDVKPQNVIITPSVAAKLLDMGCCMKIEDAKIAEETVVGTPFYIPPERCLKKGEDHRSDIYSLGLLLYLMLTGTDYIVSAEVKDMIRQHAVKLKVPVSIGMQGMDPNLATLVQWMTRRNPEERPENYPVLRQTILDLIAHLSTSPAANSRVEERRKLLRRVRRTDS